MIKPTKHMNLDISVIRVTALILKELKKTRIISYEKLKRKLILLTCEDVEFTMSNAISLAFLLGRIRYHDKSDTFEYIKKDSRKNEDQ